MPSYVITGASRGIGFEFLRQLSADPDSTVIGLVRDKESTEEKVQKELRRDNIHLIKADLKDHDSLKKAAEETASITGGVLDYLIANAAYFSTKAGWYTIGDLIESPGQYAQDLNESFQINVVGNIQLFNAFIPLISKSEVRKVIALGSMSADIDLTAKYDLSTTGPYSISKAALNMAVAKYSAEFREKGILFMSIAPGATDTFSSTKLSDKEQKNMEIEIQKLMGYAPHFTGLASPESAVALVRKVMENASLENGDGGTWVSQFGNKQWQ